MNVGDDTIKAGKIQVGLAPFATAPMPREIGTAKGDFEVPENFDAPFPDQVLNEFEGD